MKIIKSACIKQELVFNSAAACEEYLSTLRCAYIVVKKQEKEDGTVEMEINKAYNGSPLYER